MPQLRAADVVESRPAVLGRAPPDSRATDASFETECSPKPRVTNRPPVGGASSRPAVGDAVPKNVRINNRLPSPRGRAHDFFRVNSAEKLKRYSETFRVWLTNHLRIVHGLGCGGAEPWRKRSGGENWAVRRRPDFIGSPARRYGSGTFTSW